ncbi:S8 family serine peptidase [[Pseudopropionibacterium] massiliense]|uniref:S8 family serine peptidase n=1 Tax=[Pseudopropionibacterium] massiliense TaxID=2220000 RepID=UPI0010306045|nr:S8 family serine peptidase [[Pseudopropionibacterium] massiliense]
MTKRYSRARRGRGTAVRALTSGVCGLVTVAMSTVPAQANHDALLPGAAGDRPAKVVEENSPTPAPGQCTVEKPTLVPQRPPAIDQLGIEEAWKISRGNGVTVAVVDSGVAGDNVHFKDKNVLLPGYDMMDGGDGSTDVGMHGTALAGQISAREVEGSGLIGVAPESQILPVRVLVKTDDPQEAQNTRGPEPTHTAAGIQWAADNGAKVIVVALSSSADNPSLKSATEYATSKGALVVASAGNVDPKSPAKQHNVPQYPAAYSDVLSVTAVDTTGAPSDTVIHGPHVDVAAPGMNVLTTFLGAGDCVFSGDKPSTSYATGYVGAVAALVAAAHPDETPADWKYRILATALRPTRSLRDDKIGWGLVAPYAALTFTNDGAVPGPPNPRFSESATQDVPTMTPPSPQKDQRPMRTMVLGIIAGIGCLGTLAALAASRLRSQDAPRRKPRR